MLAPTPCPDALRPFATVTSYHRRQAIYGAGDSADTWYCVLSGLASKSVVTAHGRRRIVDFLLPGDFFGLTALDRHIMTVEAVVEGTRIARFPRRRLEMTANADPQIGQLIRTLAFKAIARLQATLLVVGQVTAVERVGAFLVEMAERLPDGPAGAIVLSMSRYDIADYLAMSVETVSRALTELKHSGAIRLSGTRQIWVVDRGALDEGGDVGAGSAPQSLQRAAR